MNRNKYLILTLILFISNIIPVYASCTEEEMNNFKKIKNDYSITTTYNQENKTYSMKVVSKEPKKYNYVFTIDYEYECNNLNETTIECTGLKPGTEFFARVIGVTEQCDDLLKEEKIKLEYYNEFHDDPLCEGIEEFVLCQETYSKELDYETFESRVNTYKKTEHEEQKQEEIKKEEEKSIESIINKIISYIKENLLQIIIVTTFIILLVISIIVMSKSSRKSRRLE